MEDREKWVESEHVKAHLNQGKKGLIHVVFSRFGIIVLLLLLQLFAIFAAFYWLNTYLPYFVIFTGVFSTAMALYLLSTDEDASAKITWLIAITILPVIGAPLYAYTKSCFGTRVLRRRMQQLVDETQASIPQDIGALTELKRESPGSAALATYMHRTGCFPVYDCTDVKYYPDGESKWLDLLEELEKAEHFIFLEYFIIEEGEMWGSVLDILTRKAQAGLDVRVLYDGTCEFSLLPHSYPEQLKRLGIKCKAFNPMHPLVSTHYNYRDHRKIVVVDGHTAFTGGVNLADEYINRKQRFGYWKDAAIRIKGEAVPSFSLLFLQMWNVDERVPDIERFLTYPTKAPENTQGYVLPYGDVPLDSHRVGERVYMDMLNRAQNYVYIMTPYLILDGEMETALKFAAERGVDVRLVLPGTPDKKVPWALAKTHYNVLLKAGVKIYEYTPGFVHSKVFVADDKEAVVGTINLDYRSLYHHFECAAYMYDTACISDIKADVDGAIEASRQVQPGFWHSERLSIRVLAIVAKVIAPLL
jgi:cardiolipin synthase